MPGTESNMTIDELSTILGRHISGTPTFNDLNLVTTVINNTVKEIEAIIKSTQVDCFKQFSYDVDGNIIEQNIYKDNTGTDLLFNIVYHYVSGNLTEIIVTRSSDSFTYTKTLTYDLSGNLTTIQIL